jgi:hypothetical protein
VSQRCDQCGLPLVECNAVTLARKHAEEYLRENGYTGLEARVRSEALIPEPRRVE